MPGDISFQPITRDNLDTVLALVVAPAQARFVASNAKSLAQAFFHQDVAWFRAIYAGAEPAGFIMVERAPGATPFLWRLMVAAPFQRCGIGGAAVRLLCAMLRDEGATRLQLSCVPGDDGPEAFYLGLGFVATGEVDDDEIIMEQRL